jgi:O-antigen/teichoic acid export membrane protein
VLSSVIFSLVYLATIFSIPTLYHDREFLLVAGISVLFVPLNVDWFFSGREKFKLVTLRTLAAKVIAFGGLFIFVRTRDDIIPYLILTIVANLSSQIWNFGYMLKTEVRLQIKRLQIRKHLKAVLVLFASNITISIYTMLSTLLLGFLSDYTQVGYYTSAIKVSKMILPIVKAMSTVMIERINTIKGEKNSQTEILRLLNNSFGYMMMLAVPATIGLMTVASRFVPLFFGEEFIPAIMPTQLLSSLILIIGIANFFAGQILVAMGHEKKFLIAILLGAISNFVLNILLDSEYGAIGASIASVVTEIIAAITVIILSLKVISVHFNFSMVFRPIVAALPMILISKLFSCIMMHDLCYLLTTVITCGIVYAFIMIFIFKDEQNKQTMCFVIKRMKNIKKNRD